jgi:DNA invertase Pin-like site-specific DNA recombinase
MSSSDPSAPKRALAYFRVSTDEQGADGHGMAAQRHAVGAYAATHGLEIVGTYQDVSSGKTLAKRPGLKAALARLEDKSQNGDRPTVLIVGKLDRLSRSMMDFATMIERSQRNAWNLVVVEPEIDLSTPYGRAMANVIITFAQLEREMIGERTKVALAAAKRQGVLLGRPRTMPDETLHELWALRRNGLSLRKTADALNARGIRGPQGGRWYDRSVLLAERRYGTG